jgi:hypothetical protein
VPSALLVCRIAARGHPEGKEIVSMFDRAKRKTKAV